MKWVSAQPLIGGMSLGFEQEFGKPECIITGFAGNDKQYINYTNVQRKLEVPVVTMDPTYNDILETSESKEIPQNCLWVMVPICSGLSMLNSSTKGECARGDPNNKQNQNMYNLTSLAMRNNASVIVFENAPALYTHSGEGVRNRLYEIAKENGYSMGVIKTSTLYHGIPQRRERTFAMFYRDTNPAIFEFEHKPVQDYVDYLDLIPKDATYQDWFYSSENIEENEFIKALKKILNINDLKTLFAHFDDGTHKSVFDMCHRVGLNKINELLPEGSEKKYAERVMNKISNNLGGWFDTYPRVFYGKTVNAVISKNLSFIHKRDLRFLNIRELLWLMGMPHDFQFSEGYGIHMITQNVPVVTANYIARNIKKYYEGKLNVVSNDYCAQNNINEYNDCAMVTPLVENW